MSLHPIRWFRRTAGKVTGKTQAEDEEREERRIFRETRLERRQVKTITQHAKRIRKQKGGLYKRDPEALAENKAKELGESIPTIQTDPSPEHWLQKAVDADVILPAGDVSPDLEDIEPPALGFSPMDRGSIVPTAKEYRSAVGVPQYVQTQEEYERWKHITETEKARKKAVKARLKRKGPGICLNLPIDKRGHEWTKPHGMPYFDCLECGERASAHLHILKDGLLLRDGAIEGKELELLNESLKTGQDNYLTRKFHDGDLAGLEQLVDARPKWKAEGLLLPPGVNYPDLEDDDL